MPSQIEEAYQHMGSAHYALRLAREADVQREISELDAWIHYTQAQRIFDALPGETTMQDDDLSALDPHKSTDHRDVSRSALEQLNERRTQFNQLARTKGSSRERVDVRMGT